ncbi:MAG: PASTA domain-containing protein [Oscillospiraceae bacterium]
MNGQIVCEGCKSQIPEGKDICPFCGHSFTNTNPEGALAVGFLLHDKYTIGHCAQNDGEGFIYTAINNETMLTVTIKEFAPQSLCSSRSDVGIILPQVGKEVLFKTIRMDFEELYTLLARLQGTRGSIDVLDVFSANGTCYGVQEQINGITLREYINGKRVPMAYEEILTLLCAVTHSVESMHRMGIIHRGICPDTVYITENGETKLGGYATQCFRTIGGELHYQLLNGYSAPEQYSIAEFDGYYTDVYSLGALYYFALTGKEPISANNRVKGEKMPTVKDVVRTVPAYLSMAIARAMRIQSTERMQSVEEFITGVTTAQRPEFAFKLNTFQKIIFTSVAITLVCMLGLALWLLTGGGGYEAPSASQGQDISSVSQPVVSAPVALTAPMLVGQQYVDVQNDPEYQGVFLFTVEEVFSTIYKKGEIVAQDPVAESPITKGQLIHLKVSIGPETALMPELIGMKTEDAEAELNKLKIKYTLVAMENDGSYIPYTVATSDKLSGTVLELENDSVILYIAKEPILAS